MQRHAKTSFLFIVGFTALCAFAPGGTPPDPLFGKWYIGDGTGHNVDLALGRDFTYHAVWTGCLGTYGTAKGHWELHGDKLTFTPTEETEMMRKHLRTLIVVREKKQVVLVSPKQMSDFKKLGSNPPYWCYVRDQ